MIDLELTNNRGFKWQHIDSLYFKGYIFLKNELLTIDRLLNIIVTSSEKLDSVLCDLNGCFTFIYYENNRLIIVTDKIGLFPIYYEFINNRYHIFDDPNNTVQKELDTEMLNRFSYIGSTERNHTFFKNVSVTLPSTIIKIDNNTLSTIKYFKWSECHECKTFAPNEFSNSITDSIRRLIKYANGRRIVVPLSGGHDSRLILYYLHKLSYDNVITFTYGNKDCQDVHSSQKIAEYFGYKWAFVEYTKSKCRKYYYSPNYLKLANYISNAFTIPHIQDWVAIQTLLEEGYIKNDDIIVPGHSGDVMCGSMITKEMVEKEEYSPEFYKDYIQRTFYRLNQNKSKSVKKDILENIIVPFKCNVDSNQFIHFVEDYNLNERHSRVYAHAVKMYEYYNLQWYLPLWDNAFIQFWHSIRWQDRIDRNAFVGFVNDEYKILFDIAPVAGHPFWKVHRNHLINLLAKIRRIRKNYYSNPINYYFFLKYFEYLKFVIFYHTSSYYFMFGKRFIKLLKSGAVYELDKENDRKV